MWVGVVLAVIATLLALDAPSAGAVVPPRVEPPYCEVGDDGKESAGCLVSTGGSVVASGDFTPGGTIDVSASPRVGPCNHASDTGCFNGIALNFTGACAYLPGAKPGPGVACNWAHLYDPPPRSIPITRTGETPSCAATFNYTYAYGGPASVPAQTWAQKGLRSQECSFTYTGIRMNNLKGPTWLKMRASVSVCDSTVLEGTRWYCTSTHQEIAEAWIWVDGDLDPDLIQPSCSVTQSGPGGSELSFDGEVTNPGNDGYLQEWTFSDGSTSLATDVAKTALVPGPFEGVFRVYRTDGSLDVSATCTAEVSAPDLGVAISFPGAGEASPGIPNTTFGLDESVPARVHLIATDDGIGDLTNVGFVGEPLEVTPAANLEVTSGPTPAIPSDLTLAPGEEITFDYELRTLVTGQFGLGSTAVATDAAGRTIGPVEADVGGRVGSLDVEVVLEPEVVELEESDEEGGGPEPEGVKVTVRVTNPLTEKITAVDIEARPPSVVLDTTPPEGYLPFTYLVPPAAPTGEFEPGLPEPVTIDEIAPGATVERTFDGQALEAGKVDLLFHVDGTHLGAPVSGAGTSRLEIKADVVFEFDADIDAGSHWLQGGDPWVDGGQEWRIDGTFENRTHDRTFEVVVLPMLKANAGYGVPIPELTTPPDLDCGIGVARIVEPGEEIEFEAPVRTLLNGGTRSIVDYQPQVFEILDDGSKVEVDAEHVLVTPGSAHHEVHVATADRPPEVPGAGGLVYVYGSAAIDEFQSMVSGLAIMALDALAFALQPWTWPHAYDVASSKVAEYVKTVYENLDEADKAAWNASWVTAVTWATGQAVSDAVDLVDRMSAESFTELTTAWETGDYATVAAWWGKQTGAAPDIALGALTKAYGVCKLISSKTPWARKALLAREAEIAAKVEKLGDAATAKSFPTGGFISRVQRRLIWGIDDVMDAKVQAFVDRFGIAIGVRRRGPGSIAKIEAGTHNPKGYHQKAKNITQTDVDWMGMLDDLDTSAIVQPPSRTELMSKLLDAGVDADTRARVLARHRTRMKEWYGPPDKNLTPEQLTEYLETGKGAIFAKSERNKWVTFELSGFPVPKKGSPLDYRENVKAGRSLPPDDAFSVNVPAEIERIELPDGREQWVLKHDRGDGMKASTGDMDPVIVTKADFSLLPEAKRLEFYERAHELGFEHVESATWNDPAGRNAYLQEFSERVEGSEAIFTWLPKSQPRATRFDPQQSWFNVDDATMTKGRIYLRGANVVLESADPHVGDEIPELPGEDGGYVSPKTIFLVNPDCPGSDGGESLKSLSAASTGSCSVVFDRGDDSITMRRNPDGTFEQWTEAGGWVPLTVAAPGAIAVLPQSVITEPVGPGATEVEIASGADLDLVAGVDEWFAVGDVVVIDPGGPNEEHAVIGGFGSLIFTEPLQHAHAAGTLVTVVDAVGDPDDPRDPNGPVTGTGGTGGSVGTGGGTGGGTAPVTTAPPVGGGSPGDPVPSTPGPDGPAEQQPVGPGDEDVAVAPSQQGGAGTATDAAVPRGSALPFTGSRTALLLGVALTLLVLGTALQLGSAAQRRRRNRLW